MHNRAPGFPEIASLENVWLEVVEFMSVHRHISGVAVVRRRFDQIHSAPLRHFRGNVRPMLTVIGGDLHEAIVCACPDRALFYWRFGQCKNGVVIFDRSDVVR